MISRAPTKERSSRKPPEQPKTPSSDGEGGVEVRALTTFAELREISPQWESLQLSGATTNPFTHPAWVTTWAEHYLQERDLFVLVAHRGAEVVGIAPLYWISPAGIGRHLVHSLHVMGNGHSSQFTEIPGILTERDDHRAVLGAVVRFLQTDVPRLDWAKVTIDARQGWFEPQWLEKSSRAHSPFVVHHATRACVVLDLPDTWEGFLAARKRNVRESIRRGFNRLDKQIGDWAVEVVVGERPLVEAVERVIELHEARAQLTGKPKHPSMFAGRGSTGFYRDAVAAMAAHGQAEVSVLRLKGEPVAGLVTLRAGDHVYSSVTGADPAAWDFGPGTILIAELARREIARGTAAINLSNGPNRSKLRWSERLEFNHDFMIVGSTSSARMRFGLFSQASNFLTVNRMKGWNTYD